MKKAGLYKKMRENAVIPILLLGFTLTLFGYVRFSNTMYNEAKDSMRIIANTVSIAYNNAFPGDFSLIQNKDSTYELYKGDVLITDNYTIIDDYSKASDTDISILYLDMRVHTTFKTDSGARIAGVFANSETAKDVLFGQKEVFYKNIDILGNKYLVLYVPLYNASHDVMGMIEIAREMSAIKKNVWLSIWPFLVISIVASVFAIMYSYKNTRDIISVLSKLQAFLNKVAGGNLQAELDSSLTRRTDELGDISKSSVKMQKSIRAFIETDPLTGLNNRRYIITAIQKVIDKHKANGTPFSLAICDIDFFKKVNDTYGHNAGDDVLKAVANTLKEGMKGSGYLARWGGEEFLLVFDRIGMEEGAKKLNLILDNIRSLVVESEDQKISVTMTFGIVEGSDTTVEGMVSVADEKLYYGKMHGRNQVVCEVTED